MIMEEPQNVKKPRARKQATNSESGVDKLANATPAMVENVLLPVRQMNNMALLSFIFSLLFFIPLNSIVAIVLGHVALSQFKQNPNQDGEWAAKAGLIISYSVIGIIALIALTLGMFALVAIMLAATLS
jgi:hypothetical protein